MACPVHTVFDEFVAFPQQRPLDVLIGEVEGFPAWCALLNGRAQTLAVHRRGHGQSHQIAEGRVDVKQKGASIGLLTRGHTRPGEDQRHVDAVIVEALLAHQPVTAQGQPVVPGKDNQRILAVARFFQRVQNAPDLCVQMADHPVVVGQMAANLGLVAGFGGQKFVPHLHLPVVEGVFGQKVLRQIDGVRVVHLPEFSGHCAGVVGGHKGHVEQKGVVACVAVEKVDSRLRKEFRRVLARRDVVVDLLRDELVGSQIDGMGAGVRVAACGVEVAGGHIPVVVHSAEEDFASVGEAAGKGGGSVVPFARAKGSVALAP